MKITHLERKWLYHELVSVEGGSFMMGSNDEVACEDEKPLHEVSLTNFYIGKFPITQAFWEEIVGYNPSSKKASFHPVENVSWNEAQVFLKKLNETTGQAYRLPSEAEWEYAARGGNKSSGYLYAGSDQLEEVGWYRGISDRQTQPVKKKSKNELGIYDMSGNVWEWVEDQWHDTYQGAPRDGSARVGQSSEPRDRVRRGGSWYNKEEDCRVSFRDFSKQEFRHNNIGFRLAMSPQPDE